jgi:hypothetical protein
VSIANAVQPVYLLKEQEMFKSAVALLSGLMLLGCNSIAAPCDTSQRAGIALSIRDSVTQGPVLVDSIQIVVSDGAYSDTVQFTNVRPDPVTELSLALERPGLYKVEIRAAGYVLWTRSSIGVEDGRCHVRTADVDALLQRLTS